MSSISSSSILKSFLTLFLCFNLLQISSYADEYTNDYPFNDEGLYMLDTHFQFKVPNYYGDIINIPEKPVGNYPSVGKKYFLEYRSENSVILYLFDEYEVDGTNSVIIKDLDNSYYLYDNDTWNLKKQYYDYCLFTTPSEPFVYFDTNCVPLLQFAKDNYEVGYFPVDEKSKEDIKEFKFDNYSAFFYTPSNGSTINFHYKDTYFWKFKSRIYVKCDGDMFITDKKIMEILEKQLTLSSPFEVCDVKGTYIQRPSLLNEFQAKLYLDVVIGFPSDFDVGEYELIASFPGSGTSSSPEITPAKIKINIAKDGSIQEGITDKNGNPEFTDDSIGSGSPSGTGSSGSNGDFPTAPGSDGTITDWFTYIGDLVMWIVTYPFKLLGDVFTVLGGYINIMINQLAETANAMNGLMSFIPRDILNVAYGFISFTLLYSIVRGVLKLIRG